MVCRAFILAYRILGKIVETNGDTEWLKNGMPHCNVRRDFFDTEVGVKRLQNVIEVESEGSMTEQESSISYWWTYCVVHSCCIAHVIRICIHRIAHFSSVLGILSPIAHFLPLVIFFAHVYIFVMILVNIKRNLNDLFPFFNKFWVLLVTIS